jgi:hypothetical protein
MKKFKDVWEDAAANSVSGDGVDMPADVQHSKKKRKKAVYDGRTKEGRKFVERMLARKKAKDTAKQVNASKENQASVAMKEEQELLDEALQHVHTIKIDGNAPSNPKPSEAASIKSDFKLHVQAIRSAVKRLGGLITDTEVPSRQNKFVGKIKIGTRGDASKISIPVIQKGVKSGGIELDKSQFVKEESVELDEARPPKIKGLSIYGSEISGLKQGMKTFSAKPVVNKGKLGYKVMDEFGGFETLDLKAFAKKFG